MVTCRCGDYLSYISREMYVLSEVNSHGEMSKFADFPLDLAQIASFPLKQEQYAHLDPNEYPGHSGKEHYKLLAYLSTTFSNGTIIDIGTHRGFSALALSYNKTNTVHSFDIVRNFDVRMTMIENIQFHIENLWEPESKQKWHQTLMDSKMIFLDIDPHHGTMEYEFYCYLRDSDYQGIVICDDIWYFKGMRDNFWYQIPTEHKLDLTGYGHWSGTGLLKFGKAETRQSDKSWTFVTAYFDLTKCEDASPEINAKPASYYLQSAHTTMASTCNLVVYCEEKFQPILEALRPDHLKHKTKYIICEFDDFPLNKYRGKIAENRKVHCSPDKRNTPSYYLFCMARYEMIKRAIADNHFGSTHFAWVNVCIERYGFKNVAALEDVMAEYRDKFSTCYIDYIPPTMIANLPEYFKWGRCSLCSGFFTGNVEYFGKFCDLIEQQFLEYLEAGYGHADEQLYSPIYFKHPEIFQVYHGDYLSMVTNYPRIVEDVSNVINHLIVNSGNDKNYDVCYEGCMAVWKYCHECLPNKNRVYTACPNTSILGADREKYLNYLLISARNKRDYDMASRALAELKCMTLGC